MRIDLKPFHLVLLLALLSACTTQSEQTAHRAVLDYDAGNYSAAVKVLSPLADKTNEDFVLNNLRLGSAELALHDFPAAQAAFQKAYEVLNSFGVNNGGRTLGAVLVDEKIKIWRGEPFERAMANFYLGLTYYIQHDYNNARAAFENALFKLKDVKDKDKADSDSKDEYVEADSNFVVATVMLGRCWQRLGRDDLAHANFDAVAKARPDLAGLVDFQREADSNVLLVVDFGHGPLRKTKFDGSIVGFGPQPYQVGRIPPPELRVDDRWVSTRAFADPPFDLLAMAQDRQWQSIDTIRTVKSAVGTGLIAGGAVEGLRGISEGGARQRTDLMVSGGLLAAGLLLKATSQGDVRGWDMLPRTVFLMPLHVAPGTHSVTVDFLRGSGLQQTWDGLPAPPPANSGRESDAPDHGEATYYFHMEPYESGPYNWPPPGVAKYQQPQGENVAGTSLP